MPSGWRIDKTAPERILGRRCETFRRSLEFAGVAVVYLSEHQSLRPWKSLSTCSRSSRTTSIWLISWNGMKRKWNSYRPKKLPPDWRGSPPGPSTMRLGDQWVAEARSAVLAIPSAIVPAERNFLLNPAHPKFGHLRLHKPVAFTFDHRLAGR
jgi:RES domain-containing protein